MSSPIWMMKTQTAWSFLKKKNKNTMKLTMGGGGGRDHRQEILIEKEPWTRVPGWWPRPELQRCLCWVVCLRCSAASLALGERSVTATSVSLPFCSIAPSILGRGGALGCWSTKLGTTSFNTRLLGIFVHPAPGTQDAPDGLFDHSWFHLGSS